MNGQRDGQDIYIKERGELKITGVCDIDSFDELSAVLDTTLGELVVEGEGLRIGVLDTESGILTISGKINACFYTTERAKKKGIFSRIFN